MSKLKYYDGTEWKTVNGQITGDTLPIGSIIPYGSTTAPVNWLVCDGSAVSRTTYAELFAVIGTSFGAGDGSTTFNLPNYKGRVPVGYDSSDTDFNTIGETGGSKYLQEHEHTISKNWGVAGTSFGYNDVYPYFNSRTENNVNLSSGDVKNTVQTGNSGNLQPYQVSCFIIKAFQSSGLIANVSNTQSNSQTNTYSCDYIEDNFGKKEVYSTSEIDTSKIWTDGRKIYRRTFTGTINTTGSWITIPNSLISDLRTIIKMEGMYGGYLPIPSYINASYSVALQYNSNSGLQIFSNGYNSGDVNVIIEYTKN